MSDCMSPISDHGTPQAMLRLATGYWISQAIFVAAHLDIADRLRDGPRSAAELAAAAEVHPETLHRMLRALSAVGAFREEGDGTFALAPLGEHLRSDSPSSVLPFVRMHATDWHWRVWGELLHSVRTGEPAFEHVLGAPFFDYLATHPEDARIFDAAMTSRSRAEDAAVAASYDWPPGIIVDVGGGRGSQLAAILTHAQGSHGILFDLPHVIGAAASTLEEAGLSPRCTTAPGDFFAGVPVNGDLYLLKKVIHDWDDERARAILRRCRAAMRTGARLLVIEHILPPSAEPTHGDRLAVERLDLEMLVLTSGGRERTEAQFRALLASADLTLTQILPTAAGVSLIEAAGA